jgi:hypothetical protein
VWRAQSARSPLRARATTSLPGPVTSRPGGLSQRVLLSAAFLVACSPELPVLGDGAWQLASTPGDAAEGVGRQARIVVALDRLVMPNSIDRAHVSVRSGSIAAATDLRLQPLTRELWIDLRGPLDPGVRYELQVRDLVDLDALPQPGPYRAHFQTGFELEERVPEAGAGVDVSEILRLLDARCARQSCHGGSDPVVGLDLGSASGIERSARNARSQVLRSSPSGAGSSGLLYIAAPLLIDTTATRGDPARSYLIYKLLGPDHILGEVMPPPGEPSLSRVEIQALCDWIFAGAPTRP